jgi:EmrB/QacA subfamily drug resistance transporter
LQERASAVINPKARPCDEATIRAVPCAGTCLEHQKRWVLALTILSSTMAYVDESVVNVALPAIEHDLGTSVVIIQWLVNAYTLSLTALLLVGGAAGDRFGRRRVFIIGTSIFAAASIGCGLSTGVAQLILARVIQGVGAALLIPCALAIIGASFSEAERGKAIGTWAGFSAISAAIGPLVGGLIVDHASWRWIFLINPFIALPTIWMALRHVPESRDPDASASLDWPGAALALAGLGSLVFGLMAAPARGARDAVVIVTLLTGTLLLIAFVWQESRGRAPMMPLGLFRSRVFSGVNILTLLLYAALGGAFFFLPYLLIQVHGYSATHAGAVFLPFTLVMAALSRWAGGLLDRFGARAPLIIGPGIAALGFVLLALPGTGGAYWATFLLPMIVLGLGMAVTVAPLTTAVVNAVAARQTGVAAGINNAVASLANLLAVAIIGAIALGAYNRALDDRLGAAAVPSEVTRAVAYAHGNFAPDLQARGEDRRLAEAIVRDSLAYSIRLVMLLAAALALAGAACAAMTLPPEPARRRGNLPREPDVYLGR